MFNNIKYITAVLDFQVLIMYFFISFRTFTIFFITFCLKILLNNDILSETEINNNIEVFYEKISYFDDIDCRIFQLCSGNPH